MNYIRCYFKRTLLQNIWSLTLIHKLSDLRDETPGDGDGVIVTHIKSLEQLAVKGEHRHHDDDNDNMFAGSHPFSNCSGAFDCITWSSSAGGIKLEK